MPAANWMRSTHPEPEPARPGGRKANELALIGGLGEYYVDKSRPGLSETDGEMAEWFKAHAWKACVGNTTVGSNPTLSATFFGPTPFVSAAGPRVAPARRLHLPPFFQGEFALQAGGE